MRIAFFGGSFDPPHVGHLRIAHAAAERLHLDEILLAPVALQPLKREGPQPSSYADRLAMLRLLVADDAEASRQAELALPPMEISELDAPRADGQPNYTFDTLVKLRSRLAPGDKLFVLLGADSFLSMRHWYRSSELLLLAEWIIAGRPGFDLGQLVQALPQEMTAKSAAEQRDGCRVQRFTAVDGRATTLWLLPDLREDVSGTGIRAAIADGAPLPPPGRQVLSPSVLRYIHDHALYR